MSHQQLPWCASRCRQSVLHMTLCALLQANRLKQHLKIHHVHIQYSDVSPCKPSESGKSLHLMPSGDPVRNDPQYFGFHHDVYNRLIDNNIMMDVADWFTDCLWLYRHWDKIRCISACQGLSMSCKVAVTCPRSCLLSSCWFFVSICAATHPSLVLDPKVTSYWQLTGWERPRSAYIHLFKWCPALSMLDNRVMLLYGCPYSQQVWQV